MAQEPASAPADRRSPCPRGIVIWSWAIYDLANTIYSAIVITRYFVPYMHKRDVAGIWISVATVLSMFAAGLASPYAGALMDRIGRGRTLLFGSTISCVALTAALALPAGNVFLLVAYGASNFFYNIALVFYNAYLPHLGSQERWGRISGLGTGVGYVGLIPAIYAAALVQREAGTMAAVFPMAAAAFLVLSLPAFATLPSVPPAPAAARESPLSRLWKSAREIWRDRQARIFFAGNFLCTDVLNTLILWIFVYVEKAFEFSEDEKNLYQAAMVVSNIACSLVAGWLSDRSGARKAFLVSALCLLGALLIAGAATSKAVLFWATVPLAGFGLGGIWTAGRKLLFELSPPGRLGEYSGFYGFTGKVSSFTTLIYGGLSMVGGAAGHRAAILALAAPVAAGIWLIASLRETGKPPR